jgi:hypothetical protein
LMHVFTLTYLSSFSWALRFSLWTYASGSC